MSVCVVAQYPWKRISDLPGVGVPGVIVCSDTRITRGGKPELWLLAKQSHVAPNTVVCYTTEHGEALSLALHKSRGNRNVRRLGEAVRSAHEMYGGFSELIAVVWRGRTPPQILELMPPLYRPNPRTGIVGIGHRDTLRRFNELFRDDPEPELRSGYPTRLIEAIERHFGEPVPFPPPSFPIESAALHVVGALSGGIREAGDHSVALPLQLWTIAAGAIQSLQAVGTADLEVFEDITTTRENTRLAKPAPRHFPIPSHSRSAVQLFP